MKNLAMLMLVLSLVWTACSKKDDNILPVPDASKINLSDLRIGQKSTYVGYEMTCSDTPILTYTGDTLNVEVIEKDGNLFLRETFTKHSPMIAIHPDGTTYSVSANSDFLLLKDRAGSRLFYFYANDTLHIDPAHSTDVHQVGCMLNKGADPFIGNDIAYLERLEMDGIVQEKKTVVSCEPYFELDGYLIYDNYQLQQSHTVFFDTIGSIEHGTATGWVLLK